MNYKFIHIPKCAGTSIVEAIGYYNDKPNIGHHPGEPSDIEAYDYIFTVVRNPWDRAVSFYHWAIDEKNNHEMRDVVSRYDNFNDWVRHGMVGYHYINPRLSAPPACMLDYILPIAEHVEVYKLESLSSEWSGLLEKIGRRNVPLPILNTSKHGPYTEYYTTETKHIVNSLFTRDITYFKYTFD